MLYDIGFLIFSLLYIPTLLFKGKLHGDFLQRFGVYSDQTFGVLTPERKRIWIEAVSVGEVALCKTFLPVLKRELQGYDIVISTVTKSGNDLAKRLFAKEAAVIYFPLDFSWVVRKVVAMIDPSCYVMLETEIWPGLLKELSSRGVPCVLLNGRISDRAFARYRCAAPLLRRTMQRIVFFGMQSRLDAERVGCMGADAANVTVTGTMKFDIDLAAKDDAVAAIQRFIAFDPTDALFVAGSTHAGEEEILLDAYTKLVAEFPHLKLLIAPRHIDRAGEVARAIERSGFSPVSFSGRYLLPTTHNPLPVYILDTIGQLQAAYSRAALVFIGGSLVPYGGHNPIEAAVFEKPILFGPHMQNFRNVATLFIEGDGARQVHGEDELLAAARNFLQDENERARVGANATRIVSDNRGATEKSAAAIQRIVRGHA